MRSILLFIVIHCSFFGHCYATDMRSPWLDFERASWPSLKGDLECEVAIVGGGISGVATLYYLLTTTEKEVVLLEKNRIASGATGNNAGIVIAHIERPISELIDEFGENSVRKAYDDLDEAYEDLIEIQEKLGLTSYLTPFQSGAFGFTSLEIFLSLINEMKIHSEWGRAFADYLVVDSLKESVPPEFLSMVEFVPHQTLLDTLKVVDGRYVATIARKPPFKAYIMNSAKFCHEVIGFLSKQYSDRFSIYEESEITSIDLYEETQVLHHTNGKIVSKDLILCTNGYTDFSISLNDQPFTKLQESIIGREGYIAAYPKSDSSIYSLCFINDVEASPYWYYSHGPDLSILGGPEFDLVDNLTEEEGNLSLKLIHQFLETTFLPHPPELSHFWHGRMGYTNNGLRWVGSEPSYPNLWYKLACNGIGIVQAIGGAKQIASSMKAIEELPTIFPPALQKGDLIAIVFPASFLDSDDAQSILDDKAKWLHSKGYPTIFYPSLVTRSGYLAGSDSERAENLMNAWKNEEVKAIWCFRGGYGSQRILNYLDYDIIRSNPKIFIGMSDITALHQALHKKTGLVTFLAPVLKFFNSGESEFDDSFAFSSFEKTLVDQTTEDLPFPPQLELEVIQPGTARGKLVGGNLTTITSLCGTEWQLDTTDKILILEDIDEPIYHIDQMLWQLKESGLLDRPAGVILANWLDCDPLCKYTLSLEEVFNHYFADAPYPVIKNFPSGHDKYQLTLPLNSLIEIDTPSKKIRLLESPVLH